MVSQNFPRKTLRLPKAGPCFSTHPRWPLLYLSHVHSLPKQTCPSILFSRSTSGVTQTKVSGFINTSFCFFQAFIRLLCEFAQIYFDFCPLTFSDRNLEFTEPRGFALLLIYRHIETSSAGGRVTR